ncbi:hypothetical protein L596_026053 [Steinernema carpocapsae]|uniref:G-protein coupled receptors family 1 profile domain-containing protein n=1 Tax=Steinernema carpocapsae TaxID=34508 RepID=A0A4U5M089_STECR|nr:hypothetical protein L596_026053 [Steinernema carpocapsae]
MGALTNWSITRDEALYYSWYLTPVWILMNILCFLTNGVLLAVTARSQKLRSACNVLIAIQAFSDIISMSGSWIMIMFVYTRTFVPISTCFFLQLPFFSALNITTGNILVIGLDRWLAVKYVAWYRNKSKLNYFAVIFVVFVTYLLLVFVVNYQTLTNDEILCFTPDGITGKGKDAWAFTQTVINIAVIAVYANLKRALRRHNISGDVATKRIFRSLYINVMFYVIGWVTTMTLVFIMRILVDDPNLTQVVEFVIGLFGAVNLIVPCFVFYTQSALYKAEIRKLFGSNHC